MSFKSVFAAVFCLLSISYSAFADSNWVQIQHSGAQTIFCISHDKSVSAALTWADQYVEAQLVDLSLGKDYPTLDRTAKLEFVLHEPDSGHWYFEAMRFENSDVKFQGQAKKNRLGFDGTLEVIAKNKSLPATCLYKNY